MAGPGCADSQGRASVRCASRTHSHTWPDVLDDGPTAFAPAPCHARTLSTPSTHERDARPWRGAGDRAVRAARAAAAGQVPADGRRDPAPGADRDDRRQPGRGPAARGDRAGRRARCDDLGRARGAHRRARGRARAVPRGRRGPGRAAGPQPPRLRRVAGRRPASSAPTWCCSTPRSPGRSWPSCSAASTSTCSIYDQEYADALADLPATGPLHVIAWEDEPADGPHRRLADRRPPRAAAAAADQQPARRAADQRHDRRAQGRATRHRRRRRRPGRDHRAGAVAGRGHRGGRGADVPRLGVRLPGARGDDGQHRGDAPPLRPRADAGDGRAAPGRRDGRRPGDARADRRRCPTR